jgi:acetyl coenzyme A synthetase (ADP forming)-like protein
MAFVGLLAIGTSGAMRICVASRRNHMRAPVRPRFVPQPCQESDEAGRLILRDGSTAHVRPATPEDRDALVRFFRDLSAESRYRRFLSASMPEPELIARLVSENDPRAALTLVVTRVTAGEPRIVATGSYLDRDAGAAEVALAVADGFRGKGLGTLLLERLALVAVRNGFVRFWALTTADNGPMLDLFRESGFEVRDYPEHGSVEIDLAIVPTEASVARQEVRDRVATVASLLPLFRPNAVAVVGASRDASAIGHRILDGLIRAGFRGPIYPVNPKAPEVAGLSTYPSVRGLPTPVDLAVIAVPAIAVLGVVDDCAARGVRALVVISAGFAEAGAAGIALQKALVGKVRGYGMRMVGPNCLGLLNANPEVRLNASFSPIFPPPGRVAMSSQSGAVGLAALGVAERYGLGFSTFVSVGNKADVSGNDLLQYWEEDPDTSVILLYLESFGNPRRFSCIARRVGRRKPVVVLHSGLTRAGGRAAGSHTAALATNATAAAALFRQTGVIRAGSLEEMFDLALALECQPPPRGSRVAVVTNAGGPGILSADACEAGGLTVPEPSPELRAKLTELFPGAASVGNPIDLIASAGPGAYRRAVETVLTCGEFDALVVLFTPVGLAATRDVETAIAAGVTAARTAGATGRPVLACVLAPEAEHRHLECNGERVPCYPFPEAPARVLGKLAAYGAWLAKPAGVFPDFNDLRLSEARNVCRDAVSARGEGWLSVEETRTVLEAAGLPLVPSEFARTGDEAVRAAVRFGFPVAVKLASRQFVHKSEVGGVRLGLTDEAAVRRAFEDIRIRVETAGGPDAMDGVLVQPMMSGGIEVMAGVTQDPLFGPLVAFGLGGIHVEVLADVGFRVAPLTDSDAAEVVRGIRGFRLLEGYRGHPPADLDAIEETLLRLSRLAEEVPEIREIDLNPIFALPPGAGCRIADARVRVRPV